MLSSIIVSQKVLNSQETPFDELDNCVNEMHANNHIFKSNFLNNLNKYMNRYTCIEHAKIDDPKTILSHKLS